MSELNNRLTIAAVLLMGVFAIGQQYRPQSSEVSLAASSNNAVQSPAPALPPSHSPRLLKFNLSLSSPKDLKVKQGDTVADGEVLADRVEERKRLAAQRKSLEIAYKQIQQRVILKPPVPTVPPVVKSLPPVSYAEEEAAIAAAAMNVSQAERAFQQQSQTMKAEPLAESSATDLARVKVEDKQRRLDNQKRKLDAVMQLKDLPPEVVIHEQEVLKQREAELQQATAFYQQAGSKLAAATDTRNEKLAWLATALSKARAEHQLALAKLQTKRDQRAYTEYEASVTTARRAEEKNAAEQSYYRQMQEREQQERDRSFQLAQLTAKISEIDNQLSTFSIVTSPYAGTIRRVKVVKQNDNNLSVELTLVVSGTVRDRTAINASANTSTSTTSPFNKPSRASSSQ